MTGFFFPDEQQRLTLLKASQNDPLAFWNDQAQQLKWETPYSTVHIGTLAEGDVQWFQGGQLNVSVQCIDRHLETQPDKTAIIHVNNDLSANEHISYRQLHQHVCRFANLLKAHGINKGDRVCLYLPMIPEAAYAMLACARIGAIHSVVFGGFSADSIAKRIEDAQCKAVITSDIGLRGDKTINLKETMDQALAMVNCVQKVIVICHNQGDYQAPDHEVDYRDEINLCSNDCPPTPIDANDPLFILYTSGSTGTPKGVLHRSAGYILYTAFTHAYAFGLGLDDIYWCTADIGWITGHSYLVYGPLANGTTTLIFEGVPTYPDASTCWRIIDEHQVNIFYTAPTAIRSLMQKGDAALSTSSRQSLRVLGTVGEPINPETWRWYHEKIGNGQAPVIDTWWQTETGGVMIAPPHHHQKPGCAMVAMPGIDVQLLNEDGSLITGPGQGYLAIAHSWPGMMKTVYGDHQRFIDTYLSKFPGYYQSGDGARRDAEDHIWLTGRIDDILNVSGHRLGTAELESALVAHPDVVEAAVVGFPHPIKGEGLYGFVTLMNAEHASDELVQTLRAFVREQIGPIAYFDHIQFASELPKTRSGKIMRRLLRKLSCGQTEDLGDTSTLLNPQSLQQLIDQRQDTQA